MTRQHPNAELFELADRVGTFVLANLLWVLLAIPVVTLPMATAGLFATMAPWTRGKSAEVFGDFFRAMRQYWLNATVVVLIDVFIAVWVALNIAIFQQMNVPLLTRISQIVTLFVALTVIMANLYLWPIMVTTDLSLRNLLMTSVKLVFIQPMWSLAMLIVVTALLIVSAFLPAAVLLLVSFSSAALFINWGAWRIIRRYIPENEQSEAKEQP
jgi:uncharacterized membrane protein YesL